MSVANLKTKVARPGVFLVFTQRYDFIGYDLRKFFSIT